LAAARDAEVAGRMVARFHTALISVQHTFAFTRPGVHDTVAHITKAIRACDDPALAGHPLRDDVLAVVSELDARFERWGIIPDLPRRLIHGDLKVSNLLWSVTEPAEVTGVVDLDTMANDGLDVELGDALRSWCNVAAEDEPVPRFSLDVHALALRGYLSVAAPWITSAEVDALAAATERIALELAARFAADALQESYFGWDPARYPSRGAHNLARARGQLSLARVLADHRPALERNVEDASRALAG
jgi:Ser/Thr protein kinase RdoA (MazF antagonist)